jgi:DNA-binding CsgD family transcriptional regulator
MKTKQKVQELLKVGATPKEISKHTNISLQSVYKHISNIKKEKLKNVDVYLSNKTINTIVERLYEKISLDLQK